MRTLIHLVEQRRQLVNDKIRFTNRLGNALKQYYPQVLAWFDQRDTPLFCDFLVRWPTLAQVKRAHRAGLERFFCNHNVRFANVVEERIRAIKAATALTTDEVVISAFRLQVEVLVEQLRTTLKAIDRFERRAQLLDQDLYLKPEGTDYDLISGECRGGLDGPYALLDDVGEANIVIAKEPLQTSPVSALDLGQRWPAD